MGEVGGDREAELYAQLQPLLFSIAYRMLASVSEAEDVVQEAFLRFHRADREDVVSPRAFLTTITTRLAIDELRSARARREQYVGEWLPEPLVAQTPEGAQEHAELAESLSMAFLVVLEVLSPVERAVFLLHDVFDYPYAEIAPIVGKSEDNCRQVAARARRRVEARRPRFAASHAARDEIGRRFLAAAEEGDTAGLIELLTADARLHGDGGGKAPAIARPVEGRQRVAQAVTGLARLFRRTGLRQRPTTVNGQLGALYIDADGRLINVVALEIAEDGVSAVRSIVNPDKLRHLGPVGDVNRLIKRRGAG